MIEWVKGKVKNIIHWSNTYFTLFINAPVNPFIAGQFIRIGLEINDKKIYRAYSYVNAPKNKDLEFYLASVPEGKLTPFLQKLNIGDNVLITKNATGHFILKNIPSCKNLWMMSTGTALGPYLSILEQGENLERFEKIILVHANRFFKDFNYLPKILELQKLYKNKLVIRNILSREKVENFLTGHIPDLIQDNLLEKSVGFKIEPINSHVMLCGNTKMIQSTQRILQDKYNMQKNLKFKPGNITSECYW